MNKVALPKKIEIVAGSQPNQKQIIIEPCFPGYGATLGNVLRRVLLASLPGAAVIGVKIKGAGHEFTSLPNVKEDILQIILNLKQLRLKIFSEEIVKLELVVRGEKPVTAADITKNSQVKIANPDLVLAHITDMAGALEMEIYVSAGMGYETVESRESKKHEIGYIEIDSIFTPVFLVSVNVENIRVGKMTNWDKLILNIITDGTITPEEAFDQAAKILIDQFNALISRGEEEKEEKSERIEEKVVQSEEETAIKPEIEKKVEEQPAIQEMEIKPKKRGRPRKILKI